MYQTELTPKHTVKGLTEMPLAIELPNGESPTHPGPRSSALWSALMALHHIRFDYPPKNYFTDNFTGEQLDANIEIVWTKYLEVALDEMPLQAKS